MFYCKLCFYYRKGPDYKSLDDFRTHLSSEEHAQQENRITESIQFNEQEHKLGQLFRYEQAHPREVAKSKRMRKAFRTGFRLLDNHLRFTYRGARRRARQYKTCKKEW